MPRSKTAGESQSESTSPITGEVWRFVEYEARWGNVRNDQGKAVKVPKYIKWYINAWEGCEGDVVSALSLLRAEPDFIWLQGALCELLTRATNTRRPYQGYLFSTALTPATATDVGRILRIKGRGSNSRASAVLRKLREVGILELVTLGESTSRPGKKRASSAPDKAGRKTKKRKVVASGRANAKRKGPLRGRKAVTSGTDPPDSLKKGSISINRNSACAEKENRSAQDTIQAQRVLCIEQVKQMQANTSAAAKRGLSPTSSTNPDEPGRVPADIPTGRIPARPSIPTVGHVLALSAHRYNGAAWAFADEILIRVGYITPAAVDEVRRHGGRFRPDQECERAHWAKAYHMAMGDFDSETVALLVRQIATRADGIRPKRGNWNKPEARLMRCWYNLVKDEKRKGKAIG